MGVRITSNSIIASGDLVITSQGGTVSIEKTKVDFGTKVKTLLEENTTYNLDQHEELVKTKVMFGDNSSMNFQDGSVLKLI